MMRIKMKNPPLDQTRGPREGEREKNQSNLAKKADSRTSFNDLMDTHVDFSAFVMNQLKVDILTPELLAVPVSYDKHALWGISHWGRKRQQFYGFVVNRESAQDVYSKHRIIVVTELQIFNDDILNVVRTALDDRLKRIRMQYLPQTIWRLSDKDRAAKMIQDIDKQLKTRRIMRSLEKFVGGRLYEGDFRLLQRTL
nr:hypothetical protein [Tanacetum cinerariifolium]